MSYLNARDPSIFAWTERYSREIVAKNIFEESRTDGEEHENVRVFLRMKKCTDPSSLYEQQQNVLVSKSPAGKDRVDVTKKYVFSKIFEADCVQTDLFNYTAKQRVLDFINGKNHTLLTYGVSGSGKTFTLIGTDNDPGLIPRSLEYLFNSLQKVSQQPTWKPLPNGTTLKLHVTQSRIEKDFRQKLLNIINLSAGQKLHRKVYGNMQKRLSLEPTAILGELKDVSVDIWVSFAEIYNEHVYDLLVLGRTGSKQRPNLKMVNINGNVHIKDLTSVNVSSAIEAYEILQYGLQFLKYAATTMNSHSSRSHCIFTIKLVQAMQHGKDAIVSCFNFCDLAGSERLKKTLSIGDRLKESKNINTSLMVLHRCIKMLRDAQQDGDKTRIPPFRESKLTQLFQNALLGSDGICMIVNVNPSKDMFDETQHVLDFSAITKDIVTQRQCDLKPTRRKRYSQLLEGAAPNEKNDQLRKRIAEMQLQVEMQKTHNLERQHQVRCQVADDYEEGIQETNNAWQQRYNDTVKSYEERIQLLKDQSNISVINLDDSREDRIAELKQRIMETKQKNNNLEVKINKLSLEEKWMKQENENLQKIVHEQDNTIVDLNENIIIEEEKIAKQKTSLDEASAQMSRFTSEKYQLEAELEDLTNSLAVYEELSREEQDLHIEDNVQSRSANLKINTVEGEQEVADVENNAALESPEKSYLLEELGELRSKLATYETNEAQDDELADAQETIEEEEIVKQKTAKYRLEEEFKDRTSILSVYEQPSIETEDFIEELFEEDKVQNRSTNLKRNTIEAEKEVADVGNSSDEAVAFEKPRK